MAGCDLVVVGGGLTGCVAAAAAASKGLSVRILDAGFNLGSSFGRHLSTDARMLFASVTRDRMTTGLLLPIETRAEGRLLNGLAVGIGGGGSGLLWNGICEHLDAITNDGRLFIERCVNPGYTEAEQRLAMTDSVDGLGEAGFADLRPLRIARCDRQHFVGTPGPADLLGSPSGIELRPGCVATRLQFKGGAALAVDAYDIRRNRLETFWGNYFIIAADAIRSPRLLAASGIRPEPGFPVGQFLCDHPLAVARVRPTTAQGKSLWQAIASSHQTTECKGAVVNQTALTKGTRMIVSAPGSDNLFLYWYAVGYPSPKNRLEFTGTDNFFAVDGTVAHIDEKIAPDDELDSLMNDLVQTVEQFGDPLKGWKPRWLPIGSAHHCFGTLRSTASARDDGVTDFDGRVFGFSNLYVAGPARFPAPCSSNPTLAAIAGTLQTVSCL